jgi:hypothetical protein
MTGQFQPGGQPPTPSQSNFPPPTPSRRSSGLGIAGLVLGIIAVVFAFIPGILYLGLLLGVLALVFGIISLSRRTEKGLPSTILGVFGVVIAVSMISVYHSAPSSTGSAVEAADRSGSSGPSEEARTVTVPDVVGKSIEDARSALIDAGLQVSAPGAENSDNVASQLPEAGASVDRGTSVALTPAAPLGSSAANPAPAGTKFSMTNTNRLDGSTADYDEWVDSYNDNFTSSNEYEQPDANMKYVVVTVHVSATTAGVDAGSAAYDLALSDPSGSVYDSEYLSGVEQMPSATLGAGQSATGQVAFQVPNDFHGGVLSFGDGSVFTKTG